MFTRVLGKSDIQISAMGLGCWAIGGPNFRGETPIGWSTVDDAESIHAIRRALDRGITFFDTADVYGSGHSEHVLGQALAGKREQVVIATKFGNTFEEEAHRALGRDVTPEYIHRACDASLRRLNTDHIDLYQLHVKEVELSQARVVRDTLEELVVAGKIRWYGWSTDDARSAREFGKGAHCASVQQKLNLFEGNPEILDVCDEVNLASIIRSPLAMGVLTGKFTTETRFPADDVRVRRLNFQGPDAAKLRKLDAVRDILTEDGRTLAQAALGWLWARSNRTIPIPGFKTVAQVEENAGALKYGPLTQTQMERIAAVLGS